MNAETTPQTAPINEAPIVAFSRDVLNFPLFPRQAEIVSEIYSAGSGRPCCDAAGEAEKVASQHSWAPTEATAGADVHLRAVPPGERVAVLIVATSQRQSRVIHKYVSGFLHSPALEGLIESETADEIRLRSGVVVMTMPAHAASVRGIGAAVVILDEAAWFFGLDGSTLDVAELWRAWSPAPRPSRSGACSCFQRHGSAQIGSPDCASGHGGATIGPSANSSPARPR